MPLIKATDSNMSSRIGTGGDFNRAAPVIKDILHIVTSSEETSRIIIVIEDVGDSVAKAIKSIHSERSKIKFIWNQFGAKGRVTSSAKVGLFLDHRLELVRRYPKHA